MEFHDDFLKVICLKKKLWNNKSKYFNPEIYFPYLIELSHMFHSKGAIIFCEISGINKSKQKYQMIKDCVNFLTKNYKL